MLIIYSSIEVFPLNVIIGLPMHSLYQRDQTVIKQRAQDC